jgi:hypothetical protein
MDYKQKIEKAISLAKNIDDIDYLEEKIKTTSQINRRTIQGRELTEELLTLTNKKAREFIDKGELPF